MKLLHATQTPTSPGVIEVVLEAGATYLTFHAKPAGIPANDNGAAYQVEGTADEFQKVLAPTGLTQPANTERRTFVVRIPESDYPTMTQAVQQLLAHADPQ